MSEKKRVLILCTGNSARSQMAEGLLRHDGGDKFEVESAGVEPSSVRPEAIQVMKEIFIDISNHRSKSAAEFVGQSFDFIITVCDNAKETCPFFRAMRRVFTRALKIRQHRVSVMKNRDSKSFAAYVTKSADGCRISSLIIKSLSDGIFLLEPRTQVWGLWF